MKWTTLMMLMLWWSAWCGDDNASCDLDPSDNELALLQHRRHNKVKEVTSTSEKTKGGDVGDGSLTSKVSRIGRPRRRFRRSESYGPSDEGTDQQNGEVKILKESAQQFQDLLPQYEEKLDRLQSAIDDLEEEFDGFQIPSFGATRQGPATSSEGPCEVNVTPKATCLESEIDGSSCRFDISNKVSEASANFTIIPLPGCILIENKSQELFVYCNDISKPRRVTATTCSGSGTAQFAHRLAAFTNSSRECRLEGCSGQGQPSRYSCDDAWQGPGEDGRTTIKFVVPPGKCAFIVHQPVAGPGDNTDVLTISSNATDPPRGGPGALGPDGTSSPSTSGPPPSPPGAPSPGPAPPSPSPGPSTSGPPPSPPGAPSPGPAPPGPSPGPSPPGPSPSGPPPLLSQFHSGKQPKQLLNQEAQEGTTSTTATGHNDGDTTNEKSTQQGLDAMTEYLEQHFKDLDKEIKEHFKDIDVHIKAIETKSDSTFPQVQFASEFDPEPPAHEAATEGRSKKLKKLVKGGKLAKAWSETESFELCKTVGRNGVRRSTASSNVSTFLKMKDLSTCDPTKEVAVFEPGSDGTYNIACCAKEGLHCSGCMELSEDKGSCERCSGGFTDSSGTCEACLDLPGWENIDGINCYDLDLDVNPCDDEKVRGLSSNEACCKCGGGQRTATPFTYFVDGLVVGEATVVGHPVPRTAARYFVDKDCEMSKHGLTINSETGALELLPDCSAVGCDSSEPFTVSCTITAEQSSYLRASAEMTVVAYQKFSYGNNPLVFDGSGVSYSPVVASGLGTASYQELCSPSDASNALTLNEDTGELTWSSTETTGGVTGVDSVGATTGAVCYVTATLSDSKKYTVPIVVLKPEIWSELDYAYGGTLYATVGERSLQLKPIKEEGKLPPSRFSAYVEDTSVSYDILTGVGLYKGHVLFHLDVTTGYFRLEPAVEIGDLLSSSDTRASMSLTLTIFAHYEWPVLATGPVKSVQLPLSIWDTTCWLSETRTFGKKEDIGTGSQTLASCKTLCKSRPQCTHIRLESSTCYEYGYTGADISDYSDVETWARYPSCGERSTCLSLTIPDFHYLSGEYCPYGESAFANGQVFLKLGRTEQDSFWLVKNDDASLAQCTKQTWVLRATDPDLDFWNASSNHVEHRGSIVACFNKPDSVDDLVTGVHSSSLLNLEDMVIVEVETDEPPAANAALVMPSCGTPNVTMAERVQTSEAGSETTLGSGLLILDDPATSLIVEDYWLHPCQCVPRDWDGAPVTPDAIADIPPNSGNQFLAPPFEIVSGAFVCEQEFLLQIHHTETDSSGESLLPNYDEGSCRTHCAETSSCRFFWSGTVGSSKQCWTYSDCQTLYRRVGLQGRLMAWPKTTHVCRIADAQQCWHVTKRRQFLKASIESIVRSLPPCLYQSLFEQCDQKLMLGGTSVESCGQCKFAALLVTFNPSDAPLVTSDYGISVLPFNASTPSLFEYQETTGTREDFQVFFGSSIEWGSGGLDRAAFDLINLPWLYGSNCYYLKGDKDENNLAADKVWMTIQAEWNASVFLAFWEESDHASDGFYSWSNFAEWQYWTNTSNFVPLKNWDAMWFYRYLEAGVELNLYGSGRPCNVCNNDWPYLAFVCPADPTTPPQSLTKKSLPSDFQHGAAVVATCWDERYSATSDSSSEIRCVAGAWINSNGGRGLGNFECAACIEVVSRSYQDLANQGKQEIYFASRWKLVIRFITGAQDTFSVASEPCACATLVPKITDAPESLRLFQCDDSSDCDQCLAATETGFEFQTCDFSSRAQLLDGNQVSAQIYQQYLTFLGTDKLVLLGANNLDGGDLANLADVTIDDGCDASLVLRSFSFGQDSESGSTEKVLGLKAQCIPVSIISETFEEVEVPLRVAIRNRQYGTCMRWQTCVTDALQLCITGVAHCDGTTSQLFWKVAGGTANGFEMGNGEVSTGEKFKLYPSEDASEDADSAIQFYFGSTLGFDSDNKDYVYGQEIDDSIDSKIMADGEGDPDDEGKVSNVLVSFRQQSEFDLSTTQCAHDSTCFDNGPWTPESFQWDFLEVPGFADVQIDCGQGKAIQNLTKSANKFKGGCVEVAGLSSSGGCFEKVSLERSLFNLEEIRFLELDCGAQAAMQALNFEVNALSQNLRMKARCCPLVALPVALVPTTEFSEDEDTFEGKYCSTGLDDSGRPKFEQVLNFINVDAEVTGKLEYNRFAGKWCLESTESTEDEESEPSCVEEDVVHPLDLGSDKELFQGESKSLYVLPMLDFNSEFVGVGTVGLTTPKPAITKWTSPPALLRFAADDPKYRPECKDQYHPGYRPESDSEDEDDSFDREGMNDASRSLWQEGEDAREGGKTNRAENPCGWIWSQDPNTAADGAAVGLGWKPRRKISSNGRFEGSEFDGDSNGVTYRTVKGCADREVSRIQDLGFENFFYGNAAVGTDYSFGVLLDLLQWYIDAAETVGKWALPVRFVLQLSQKSTNLGLGLRQNFVNRRYGVSDTNDCLTLQHGLARIFCDLHCIRDAVKEGDKAILSNLEKATEVINNNTKRLLEFYLSDDQGADSAGFVESQKVIVEGMSKSLVEMRQMLQTHLHPMAASATTRSINTFLASTALQPKTNITDSHSSRNLSNLSFQLDHLASKVTTLHSTLSQTLSSHKVSASQSVSDRTGEYVTTMMKVVKAKAHTLGIHKNAALKSKERQHWLRSHSSTSVKELLLEMQDEFHEDNMKLAMDSIDKTWWMLRSKLDMYFDVMEEYWGAFKSALVALDEYTDRCSMSFSGLKSSYAKSARANEKSHTVLKDVWAHVNPMAGLLVSQVLDTEIFKTFATRDISVINATKVLQQLPNAAVCIEVQTNAFNNRRAEGHQGGSHQGKTMAMTLESVVSTNTSDASDLMMKAVEKALQDGLFGQMLQQFAVLFEQMDMLVERFHSGGLGNPPNEEVLQDSKQRMLEMLETHGAAKNLTVDKLLRDWTNSHCHKAN